MPTISGGPQARDCRVAEDRAVRPPAGPRRRPRAGALEGEKRSREARRERLELPAIDKEMLSSLLGNFEKVMAEGPNQKKNHLLHRLVKKVIIYSRQTIEIWYVIPNPRRFEDCNIWLPKCNSFTSRPGRIEPEVWFRIVLAAHNGTCSASCREPTVEIAWGPPIPL